MVEAWTVVVQTGAWLGQGNATPQLQTLSIESQLATARSLGGYTGPIKLSWDMAATQTDREGSCLAHSCRISDRAIDF